MDVHLFVVVLYTNTDPFILPLVVVSISAIFDIVSTKLGFVKLEDESVITPSESATWRASLGVTIAIVSGIFKESA